MRIAMNTLMLAKWRALGYYQCYYVPNMVGPFLKVSLIPHTGGCSLALSLSLSLAFVCWHTLTLFLFLLYVCLSVCLSLSLSLSGIRRATIPIFYDMMENEYKHRKNFHTVG